MTATNHLGRRQTARKPLSIRWSKIIRWETVLIGLLVVTSIINAELSPQFMSFRNFANTAVTFMPIGLMALPATLIILTKGIDLSVASIMGFSAVVMGLLFQAGMNIWVAAVGCLIAGALAGLVNGLAVSLVGLPSLIVTLATLNLFRGLGYGLIGDDSAFGFPDAFVALGRGSIPGTHIPVAITIFVVFAVVFALLLHKSVFGRVVYAIGNSEEASRYAGISVRQTNIILFVLSGAMSACAGIIWAARFESVRGDTGAGLELDVITAVLLGGVSAFGGKGSMIGPIIALILIGEVRYGMDLQNMSAQVQNIAVGGLLIISVLVDEIVHKRWIGKFRGTVWAWLGRG